MELLKGKVGIIMGIANNRSIAAAIAQDAFNHGAELGFSHIPDDKGKMEQRVRKVVDKFDPHLLMACDCNNDNDLETFYSQVSKTYGSIDFLVHSIAFAPIEDIRCKTIEASRSGFLTALETSVYSFIAATREATKLMKNGGSILTLTYFGGEKVVAGYNLMGVAKAALESAVKYLAFDLGPKNIRVNSISAGPIKTLAASAVGDFGDMLGLNASVAPLGRNITAEEVANTATFILSDLSKGITGENIHVDGGYNIMGSPGYALEKWNIRPRNNS